MEYIFFQARSCKKKFFFFLHLRVRSSRIERKLLLKESPSFLWEEKRTVGLTNEGANFYALERVGKTSFPQHGRKHKAEGGIFISQ